MIGEDEKMELRARIARLEAQVKALGHALMQMSEKGWRKGEYNAEDNLRSELRMNGIYGKEELADDYK